MKCEICHKRPYSGSTVSHSNRHTKRWFKPNVRRATLVVNGVAAQFKLCTRCLRTYHKAAR